MALVADENATTTHTGTTVVGPVGGTVDVGSNNFVSIESELVMVDDGTLEVPSHQYASSPDLFHSHSFVPDAVQQSYFLIEGRPVILKGDSYNADPTEIDSAGSNTFVTVN